MENASDSRGHRRSTTVTTTTAAWRTMQRVDAIVCHTRVVTRVSIRCARRSAPAGQFDSIRFCWSSHAVAQQSTVHRRRTTPDDGRKEGQHANVPHHQPVAVSIGIRRRRRSPFHHTKIRRRESATAAFVDLHSSRFVATAAHTRRIVEPRRIHSTPPSRQCQSICVVSIDWLSCEATRRSDDDPCARVADELLSRALWALSATLLRLILMLFLSSDRMMTPNARKHPPLVATARRASPHRHAPPPPRRPHLRQWR
jgi:hypothetical protein